jgi:hypothetical protein
VCAVCQIEPCLPNRMFLRRCGDDRSLFTHLALLQNEAVFQFPQDALASGIVPPDFFRTRSALLCQLQSAVAVSVGTAQPHAAVGNGEYDHAYYYKEVLKIFLCGNKVSVPDIRQIFSLQGCTLSKSGDRRLYDAIAVMLSAGLIKRHDDPKVVGYEYELFWICELLCDVPSTPSNYTIYEYMYCIQCANLSPPVCRIEIQAVLRVVLRRPKRHSGAVATSAV